MALTVFEFEEKDLLLSLRYYLLHEPVRNGLSLPDLFPTMQTDLLQHGVRVGDLFTEENLTIFPALGLVLDRLYGISRGHGFHHYIYGCFLDALCKVTDTKNHMDRAQTELQRLTLLGDIRRLLVERRSRRGIPYYIFNTDGTLTTTEATFQVSTDIEPILKLVAPQSTTTLHIAGQFSVEIFYSPQTVEA